jgi:very-short-patch-repair endonuclease
VLAQERDDLRTIFLENPGMRVVRFENCEVMENLELVLKAIRAVLREHVS